MAPRRFRSRSHPSSALITGPPRCSLSTRTAHEGVNPAEPGMAVTVNPQPPASTQGSTEGSRRRDLSEDDKVGRDLKLRTTD